MAAEFDWISITAIALALFLGGVVKGATGAGTPVVAVPVIAAFLDVRLAVVIMVVPNLMTNLWQQWLYRSQRLQEGFTLKFSVAGGIGALIGTTMLASLPTDALSLALAVVILAYIGLRITRPEFRLAFERAARMVVPMGIAGGILQGMAGISAPVAVSFLNAMRLERQQFIATISGFFTAMTVVQIPSLYTFGLYTPTLLGISVAALLPLFVALPLGGWLAHRMSAQTFDRALLVLLTVLAFRLLYTTVA